MNHKWLTGVRQDDPISHVTDVAMRARLAAVQDWLQKALVKNPSVESIHQLRVSVRRARAAAQFFKPCLSPKRLAALTPTLRELRRVAGPLRDLDVLIDHLAPRDDAHTQQVVSNLRQARKKNSARLWRQLDDFSTAVPEDAIDKLCRRIRWRKSSAPPTWPDYAAKRLSKIQRKFIRRAERQPSEIEALHALRIEGKRLRYALELGVGAYPEIRKQLYPTMANLQEKLGAINDLAVSVGVLRQLQERGLDDREAFRACEIVILQQQTSLATELAEITEWWETDPLGEFKQSWYAIFASDPVEGAA